VAGTAVQQQDPADGRGDRVDDGDSRQCGSETGGAVGTLHQQEPQGSQQGDAGAGEQHRDGGAGLPHGLQHYSGKR
jgi:hypothetical protein